ncbi:hypothetical protein LguiB_020431 [Lonicera macranthoides]
MLPQINPKLVELCAKIGAKRENDQVFVEDNDLENQRGYAVNVNAEEVNVNDDCQGSRALEPTKKKVYEMDRCLIMTTDLDARGRWIWMRTGALDLNALGGALDSCGC